MSTPEKCEAIIRKMIELANERKPVFIEEDFGGWTATIGVGGAHTHIGIPSPDGSFELLVENLYHSLHGGPGLSFFDPSEGSAK